MAALVLLTILILLIGLLALLPIQLEVHTGKQEFCRMVAGHVVRISGEASEAGWYMHIRFFFFRRKINLLDNNLFTTKNKQQPTENKPKKSKAHRFPSPFRLLKAFRLQQLEWTIDTGNYLQNARLYPLFYGINRESMKLSINFSGQNIFILKARTRLFHLAAAFLS